MSDRDEEVFMQPYGEDKPRLVRVFDLIGPDVPIVEDDKRKHRMDECRVCPSLINDTLCDKCSCFMPVKTWLKDATCPLGKW